MAGDVFNEMADTLVTGDIHLPATILMPIDADDAPIVVMVHGSGALDRDETIYTNKPFRPSSWRSVSNPSRRPVRSLCT